MSFKCTVCGYPQGDHSKPVRVVTKIRNVAHPRYRFDQDGIPGTQIAKEIDVCGECAKTAPPPEIVEKKFDPDWW